MSALKNKNKRLDLDKREQNQSVVQRFITEEAPAAQEQNNAGNIGIGNAGDGALAIPQKEQSAVSTNIIQELINPSPVASAAPTETAKLEFHTQVIAAQLEKLEIRLGKLDKLDKLDGLSNLEQKPEQKPPKYILFNAMEEAVKEEVRATLNNVNICKCDKCYSDICALVLNNMIPQYVTSKEGVLMKKAKTLLNIDILKKLSGEIFDAIEKVKNKPDHK